MAYLNDSSILLSERQPIHSGTQRKMYTPYIYTRYMSPCQVRSAGNTRPVDPFVSPEALSGGDAAPNGKLGELAGVRLRRRPTWTAGRRGTRPAAGDGAAAPLGGSRKKEGSGQATLLGQVGRPRAALFSSPKVAHCLSPNPKRESSRPQQVGRVPGVKQTDDNRAAFGHPSRERFSPFP